MFRRLVFLTFVFLTILLSAAFDGQTQDMEEIVPAEHPTETVEVLPPKLNSGSPGPNLDDSAWRAVQAVDQKFANVLTFLSIAIALIPVVVGVMEYFRRQEFKDFYDRLDRQLEVVISSKISVIENTYKASVVKATSNFIDETLRGRRMVQDDENYLINYIMICFARNKLKNVADGHVTADYYLESIELHRSLDLLRSFHEKENEIGLTFINQRKDKFGDITSSHILNYLYKVENAGYVSSFENQALLHDTVRFMENRLELNRAAYGYA